MNCPKCSAPIKWYDLSPNCKKCGVHIMYYTQERDLARDAKRTELEFARARVLIAKLKANFIGGKYPIARLVLLVLNAAALVIPFASVKASVPFKDIELSIGGIGIYNMISSSLYKYLFDILSVGVAEDVARKSFILLVIFALLIVVALISFVIYLLSFINKNKFAKMLCGTSAAAMLINVVFAVFMFTVKSSAQAYSFISFSLCSGSFVSLAMFAGFFIVNLLIYKDKTEIPAKEVDLKRIEVYKKLKSGETDLDSLSMPIFETEEERLARENAIGGEEKPRKKRKFGRKKKEDGGDE